MSFLSSSPLIKACCFYIICRWSEESSKTIPFSHSTGSGISKGRGCEQIWNTQTPFLPIGFCFSHQPTERSHKCIFSPRPFILVKGNLVIAVIAAILVGGCDCSSWPSNAAGVLLPWNSAFQISLCRQFSSAVSFPNVDVCGIFFQVQVHFVTDLLLLSTLHMTVLF